MARKKVRISKSDYINEYWEKNKDKIKEIFNTTTKATPEEVFKMTMRENIENYHFNSKKTAKKAIEDEIYSLTHKGPEVKLKKAKEEAFRNQEDLGGGKVFDKISRLNKRIDVSAYIDTSIPLSDGVNPITGYNVQREIIGYWEIKNSDYVLAEIKGQISEDSFFTYYEFIDRSLLGV